MYKFYLSKMKWKFIAKKKDKITTAFAINSKSLSLNLLWSVSFHPAYVRLPRLFSLFVRMYNAYWRKTL